MTIADLTPDIALAALLDKQVEVQTSATTSVKVKCYTDNSDPNKGLDDEYIYIGSNGSPNPITTDDSSWDGVFYVYIRCAMQTNRTVKRNRMGSMIGQVHRLVNKRHSDGYFFQLARQNPLMPTQRDDTTGYATCALNVVWRKTFTN